MADVSSGALVRDEGWHATFSPSKADRWLYCAASHPLTKDIPRESSKYAAEGTAAHTVASRALTYGRDADFFIGQEIENDGFTFTVDKPMAEAVQVYLDEVRRRTGSGDVAMFEQRVTLVETLGLEEQGGTSDYFILHADGKRLTVIDYKHGAGVPVDATENTQMGLYALGVFETFGSVLDLDNVEDVDLVIVQPRVDSLSEWTAPITWLYALQERARLAVSRAHKAMIDYEIFHAMSLDLYAVTEKGCMWCEAKATCDAYRQHVSEAVFNDFQILDAPEQVDVVGAPQPPQDAVKLGQLFGQLELIEGWCRGVRAEVERRVMGGMEVIGPDGERMKIVEGKKGNRKWINAEAAAATLVTVLGPEAAYKAPELITPAAAEKAFGKKRKQEFADFVAPLTMQAPGKPKVTLGSDPAPPYTGGADESEFADLGTE